MSKLVDHDVKPGPLNHCQICGSDDLVERVNLGHQPLCDALLSFDELNKPETYYPLVLMQCRKCSLTQLSYVVDHTKVYPQDYPYRAGISWPVVAAHKQMAKDLVERFGKGLCVDIGCNDGTLLSMFQEQGCDVLGFEPTNVAAIATEAGVPTVQAFFTEAEAKHCVHKAHIVTLTNVFAHMADLGEVMRGISHILAPDGVLVIENHYLVDILEQVQFDSIYHEHIRTYTLKSLMCLFEQYGMEVFDAYRVDRYGGNIRVYVGWKGKHEIYPSVSSMQHLEEKAQLLDLMPWARFNSKIRNARDNFRKYVEGDFVGCSAPGRASTLLNYFGTSVNDLPWTGELEGSLKLNKYLPGCHIPVVTNKNLHNKYITNIVLLAWHYKFEIAKRLKSEGVKAKLWAPLPTFHEVVI